ncbi:MAG TPA: hypothetical protein VIM02_12670 [Rhizomicrobium sp.]
MKRGILASFVVMLSGLAGSTADSHPPKRWCGQPLRASADIANVATGTLSQERVWGPPSYGETPKEDMRYKIWILNLDYTLPIDADVDLSMPARRITITTLQLLGPHISVHTYDDFLGRHVIVAGKMRTQIFPGDNTPIIMEVDGLQLVGEVACDGRLLRKA